MENAHSSSSPLRLALGLQSGGFQPLLGQFKDEHPPPPWLGTVWSSPCLFFSPLLVFIYLICYCKIFASHYCVGFCHASAQRISPQVDMYSLPLESPSHPSVLCIEPRWSSCLTQQIPTGCLFYTCGNRCVSMLLSQFVPTLSLRTRAPHKSVLSVHHLCIALQIRSSAASF